LAQKSTTDQNSQKISRSFQDAKDLTVVDGCCKKIAGWLSISGGASESGRSPSPSGSALFDQILLRVMNLDFEKRCFSSAKVMGSRG
jgi:hypothetical protein